ncbi:MAG: hypothetical protein H6Q67_795 [Firmicutes bacterium]|nr:hypothetical protein [Bacillota bacterium]
MRHSRTNDYDRWERRLIVLLLSCIALLMVIQALMLKDSVRPYLSRVDSMEGVSALSDQSRFAEKGANSEKSLPVAMVKAFRPRKIVTIRIVQPQTAKEVNVTINGTPSGNFTRGEVEVPVYNGDYLEIDTRLLAENTRFVISVPKNDFIFPDNGRILEGKQTIISVGKVRFKE